MKTFNRFNNRPRFWVSAAYLVCLFGSASVSNFLAAQSPAEKAQTEWDRLHEMQQTMAAPEYIARDIEADLVAVKNLEKYRQHFKSLRDEFAADIKSGQQPFANLGYKLEHLERQLVDFERAAREYGSLAALQGDCDHMLKMAKMAVEYQAPAYFRPENDIARSGESAQVRLRYLQAFSADGSEYKQGQKLLAETRAEVAKIRESLSAGILQQNEMPADDYRGADRNALIKRVTEAWTKSGAKGKILKVGFVQPEWKRSVTWQIQNRTLYKADASRLQAFVIVSYNQQVAARHSYNLVKDHLQNDLVSGSFLDDPKQEPELMNQILMEKVK